MGFWVPWARHAAPGGADGRALVPSRQGWLFRRRRRRCLRLALPFAPSRSAVRPPQSCMANSEDRNEKCPDGPGAESLEDTTPFLESRGRAKETFTPKFRGYGPRATGGSASLPHLERQPSASSRGLGPRLASWRQKPSATCRCLALTGDLGLAPSPKFTKQALANPGAMSAAAVRPGSACSVDRDCPGEGTTARCRRRTSHSS